MILFAYACLAVALAAHVRRSPSGVSEDVGRPARLAATVLGVGFAALGLVLLDNGQTPPLGTAALSMLAVGGVTYAAGSVRWAFPETLLLRRIGWCLLVVALVAPSTLTLLLPIACLLLPTLRESRLAGRPTSASETR